MKHEHTSSPDRPAWNSDAFSDILLDSLPGIFYLYDENGRFLRWNRNLAKVTGYTNAEIERMHPLDFIPSPQRDTIAASIGEVFRCGSVEAEADLLLRNGTTRPYYFNGYRTEIDGVRCLLGLGLDISARKQVEKSLVAKDALLRAVEAMAKVGGWEFDVRTGLGNWTEEVARIHEVAPGDPVDVARGLDFYHGESRIRIEAALKAARERAEAFDLELELTTAGGATKWIRTLGLPILENGEVTRVIGSFQDISDRKQEEERQRRDLQRAQAQVQAIGHVAASPALLAGDVEVLAREITEIAARVCGLARANVWLFNEGETELRCMDLYETAVDRHSGGMVLREHEYGNEFQILKQSKFVAADDAQNDPRTAGYVSTYLRPLRIVSMLDAAIHASDKHFGLLCFEHVDTPHAWAHDEIVFARQLADKLGLAIINRQRLQAEHDLRLANSVVENSNTIVYRWRAADSIMDYVSENVRQFGYTADDFRSGRVTYLDLIHPDDRDYAMRTTMEAAAAGTDQFTYEHRIFTRFGQIRWIHGQNIAERDAAGLVTHYQGVVTDITSQKQAEDKIRRLNRLYRVSSGISALIVRVADSQELFREACKVAVQIGEFRMAWIGAVSGDGKRLVPMAWEGENAGFFDHVRGRSLEDDSREIGGPAINTLIVKRPVVVNNIAAQPRSTWKTLVQEHGYQSAAALPLRVDGGTVAVIGFYAGEPYFFDEEETRLLTELAGDLSYALQNIAQRERIDYLVSYDPLTGLPNRTLFLQQVETVLQHAAADGRQVGLLVCDLRQFRNVNSVYGRQAGDRVLLEISARLRELSPDTASISRITGDMFGLILHEVGDAASIALRFENTFFPILNSPIPVKDDEILPHFTGGVALYPTDGQDAETLFRNAEIALKKAKTSGRHYLFYETGMSARIAEFVFLENRLRQALQHGQFVLHYQPKVDLGSGCIAGLEALIRWHDPGTGLVPPAKFIPLLEETGLILDVGRWALAQAARDYRHWQSLVPAVPRVAVNVSELQLQQKNFVTDVMQAISDGESHAPLELEITESLIMSNIEQNIGKLRQLRDAGLGIAIDDFGTGYSSLSYIARLPLDALKIDRAFINDMISEGESMTIVATIISLAHSLNLKVVAEGVETTAQQEQLAALKCDQMQGFVFSRPLPRAEIDALLLKSR